MSVTTAYLVRRHAWDDGPFHFPRICSSASYQGPRGFWHEGVGPRSVPVLVFQTRQEAEAVAARLTREIRERLSPTLVSDGNLEQSSLEWDVLTEKLFALDILPPLTDDEEAFRVWWDEQSPTWTDDQRHAVWDLFDNLRFYDVTEIPLED